MPIGIILSAIFVPSCVMLIFSIIQKTRDKTSKTTSDKNFIVMIPRVVLIIGAMCALMSIAVLLCFTFFSAELPHFIFYITFGLFFWLGIYLILKTLTFKVIVRENKITVFSAFKKPYTFTFSEVVSAVRQVKKNQTKSERIVIRTVDSKKLIVESSEISYKRFSKRLQSEVKNEYLVGFNNTGDGSSC